MCHHCGVLRAIAVPVLCGGMYLLSRCNVSLVRGSCLVGVVVGVLEFVVVLFSFLFWGVKKVVLGCVVVCEKMSFLCWRYIYI